MYTKDFGVEHNMNGWYIRAPNGQIICWVRSAFDADELLKHLNRV